MLIYLVISPFHWGAQIAMLRVLDPRRRHKRARKSHKLKLRCAAVVNSRIAVYA